MSASPTAILAQPSQKRPLEEPSSPSGAGDQPEAKRPALDKVSKSDVSTDLSLPANPTVAPSEATKIEHADSSTAADGGAPSPVAAPADATHDIKSVVPSNVPSNASATAPQDESQWLHIRSIISSAEAATVIGKGGENVTLIRRMSGAKCTVSDYARGAVERVLTVSGPVDAVAKVSAGLRGF